jgi:hypothetical protein
MSISSVATSAAHADISVSSSQAAASTSSKAVDSVSAAGSARQQAAPVVPPARRSGGGTVPAAAQVPHHGSSSGSGVRSADPQRDRVAEVYQRSELYAFSSSSNNSSQRTSLASLTSAPAAGRSSGSMAAVVPMVRVNPAPAAAAAGAGAGAGAYSMAAGAPYTAVSNLSYDHASSGGGEMSMRDMAVSDSGFHTAAGHLSQVQPLPSIPGGSAGGAGATPVEGSWNIPAISSIPVELQCWCSCS